MNRPIPPKIITLALSFILSSPHIAWAEVDFQSANAMESGCRDMMNDEANAVADVTKRAMCGGILYTLINLGPALVEGNRFCPPRGATVGQANRVVLKYLDEHPDQMHRSFTLLAIFALQEAWPCATE